MRRSLSATAIAATLALTALPAHADMVVGGYSSPAVRTFAPDAQGTAAPIREISGPATQLDSPAFGVYEPSEGVIYVSDFYGKALRVYPAFAHGDIAPLRVLDPPLLGQTRASAPVAAHDEIGVIASNCCIYTWPLHASGDSAPRVRSIVWGGGSNTTTQLNNPQALIYLASSDEYAVIDYTASAPYVSRVIFHARTADGYVPPTRMITGAGVANAAGLTHDPATHRLFVLRQVPDSGNVSHGVIAVFAEDAAGDAQPLYTIEGPATQLDRGSGHYFYGIGHDPWLHRLMVSSASNSGTPAADNRIVVFDDTASGNAAPVQDLTGANLSSYVVGTPFAVPPDAIFANGFDGD